jgi:hypothetical protein
MKSHFTLRQFITQILGEQNINDEDIIDEDEDIIDEDEEHDDDQQHEISVTAGVAGVSLPLGYQRKVYPKTKN